MPTIPKNARRVKKSSVDFVENCGETPVSSGIISPLPSCEAEKFLPVLDAACKALSPAGFRMLYCCLMFNHGCGEKARISRKRLWMMIGHSELEAESLLSDLEAHGWLGEVRS